MHSSSPSENAIRGIIISCFRGDFWFAKIAVASVRYFYPDFPLYLLVDEAAGPVPTQELEKSWNVRILPMERKVWGNPCAKVSLFTAELEGRYVFIDSDVCVLGKVIERLNENPADFIVSDSSVADPRDPHIRNNYYDFDSVQSFDPLFKYPGFVFNSGQFVFSSKKIPLNQIEKVFSMGSPPHSIMPGKRLNDQGTLNYLFPKMEQEGFISLGKEDFKLFADVTNPDFMRVTLAEIREQGIPAVAHWAGDKRTLLRWLPKSEILRFFEDHYYSRVPFGRVKRWGSVLARTKIWLKRAPLLRIKRVGIAVGKFLGLRKEAD